MHPHALILVFMGATTSVGKVLAPLLLLLGVLAAARVADPSGASSAAESVASVRAKPGTAEPASVVSVRGVLKPLWAATTHDPALTIAAVTDTAVLLQGDCGMVALDVGSGGLLWRKPLVSGHSTAIVADPDTVILVHERYVAAVASTTGIELWRDELLSSGNRNSRRPLLAIDHRKVYVQDSLWLRCLSAEDGSEVSRWPLTGSESGILPVVGDDHKPGLLIWSCRGIRFLDGSTDQPTYSSVRLDWYLARVVASGSIVWVRRGDGAVQRMLPHNGEVVGPELMVIGDFYPVVGGIVELETLGDDATAAAHAPVPVRCRDAQTGQPIWSSAVPGATPVGVRSDGDLAAVLCAEGSAQEGDFACSRVIILGADDGCVLGRIDSLGAVTDAHVHSGTIYVTTVTGEVAAVSLR